MTHWLKTKYLVDHREFKRTCDHYWGDMTFEEAFQRTGKHVCIHVSASRAGGGGGAQKLLLNHISTPHVTLASAVNASCSLPGIMKPATLFMKNSAGKIEPFAVDGRKKLIFYIFYRFCINNCFHFAPRGGMDRWERASRSSFSANLYIIQHIKFYCISGKFPRGSTYE